MDIKKISKKKKIQKFQMKKKKPHKYNKKNHLKIILNF